MSLPVQEELARVRQEQERLRKRQKGSAPAAADSAAASAAQPSGRPAAGAASTAGGSSKDAGPGAQAGSECSVVVPDVLCEGGAYCPAALLKTAQPKTISPSYGLHMAHLAQLAVLICRREHL